MKKFLIFTTLLLNSLTGALACGFYPYGDELRFTLFTAKTFYPGYSPFNYTYDYFDYYTEDIDENAANIEYWVSYCGNKVNYESVSQALLSLKAEEIKPACKNAMIQYLYKSKDTEAIDYLIFAKNIENYNTHYDNPWERDTDILYTQRNKKVVEALAKAQQAGNAQIKARYCFQAIRLSYYSKDYKTINDIYGRYFSGRKPGNVIDYWSLYFRAAAEKDPALQSYYAALVFKATPEKRRSVMNYFHYGIPVANILKFTGSDSEKAAIWELHAMRKVDYALLNLQQIYNTAPGDDALGFLLMREINKLEDWIYTPYYTYFDPSLRDEGLTTRLLLERVAQDRQYAAKLLDFVNRANLNTVDKPQIFKAAKAYLLFMVKDFEGCNAYTKTLFKTEKNKDIIARLQMIEALSLTASQHKGAAIILNKIKPVITEQFKNNNYRFIFAIGRELEFLGNTTDAALLYSKSENIPYRSKYQHAPYNTDFYSDYFTYIDGMYTPQQLEQFIAAVKNKPTDVFSGWLYADVTDMDKLHDLLGIKYIRLNNLYKAAAAFKKVSPSERYEFTISDNPFYELHYTPDFIMRRDSIKLTKAHITSYLIKCINRTIDPNEKDRDYYAFLAANCYYNMGYYGNAWKMRRYEWSTSPLYSPLSDNEEFFSSHLAKYYYMQAYRLAKTNKFRALCLRMAARCERDRLLFINHDVDEKINTHNKYYAKLEKQYPDYIDDLSGCNFNEYFKARR